MSKKINLFFLTILLCSAVRAQVYKDPRAPVNARVKDLLSRMTLEEKIGQMTASDLDKPLNGNIAYGECASPFISVDDIARQSVDAKKWFSKTPG